MATLLETDQILCVAVVMTLVTRILRVLNGAVVSQTYSRHQHERRQQQSSISFLGHVSLRKGAVEIEHVRPYAAEYGVSIFLDQR